MAVDKLTPELVYGFQQAFLMEGFDSPKPTPQFHNDLWELCCSSDEHVAIAAPRGHAKSTAITHTFGLAALLFGWKRHMLIVSGTEGQASMFLKNMANELQNNQKLIDAFNIHPLLKDSSTEIIVSMGEEYNTFRVIAKGSGQSIRGMLWKNTRPDIIIGDDLETDDIVMNKERRLKFKQWFFKVLYPAASSEGIYRIAGTILHMDSLLEGFMPKDSKKFPMITTPLAELSSNPDALWKSVRFKAHDEKFKHILWPTQFSKKKLQVIKQGFIDQGIPDGYSQEYLNYPIDESNAFIRRDDLLPMMTGDKESAKRYYVAGDFAISKSTSADYSVFVVVGVDSKGMFHVVDVRRGRWDAYEIVTEILSIQERHNPELFLFEHGQIWLAIEAVLLKEMYSRNQPIRYDTVKVSQDKLVRARPMQHRTRAGQIKFNKEAIWYADFELELLRFPRAAHDDQVDALAHICQKIVDLRAAPTAQEEEDAEYTRSLRVAGSFNGRTKIGGY